MQFTPLEPNLEPLQATLIGCLFAIVIAGAAAVSRTLPQHPELVPLPFLAMLLTVLFNGRVSMIAALLLSVVIALQPVYHAPPTQFLGVACGQAAAPPGT